MRARLQASLLGSFLEALVELRAVDRGLALASKLFMAILPISILSTAVVSGRSFGDQLVTRFGLTGRGADAARELFAAPAQVQASIGVLGLVILTSSVLSFSRALERLYLDCWELPAEEDGALRKRLVWLAAFFAAVAAWPPLHSWIAGASALVLAWIVTAIGSCLFFLWTPYVLLGRRVSVRRLAPTALLTGAGLLILSVGSVIAMPELVTHNTVRYGLIGLTFSLVSWLFAASVLLISAAILGALLARHREHAVIARAAGVRAGA